MSERAELGRVTGLGEVPLTVPRRIGEILREPVLVGAAGGLLLSWVWLRDRVRLAVVAGVLALVAFCVLAASGLPILGRYLLLPASIGAILCGAGVFHPRISDSAQRAGRSLERSRAAGSGHLPGLPA